MFVVAVFLDLDYLREFRSAAYETTYLFQLSSLISLLRNVVLQHGHSQHCFVRC